jgi:hypothetical protein
MAKTEESKLEKEVENFMKKHRVWQLARYQAASNQNGIPDRLYLYKGLLLGLELKTDKGVPSDLQLRKLKAINDNGGIGLIITNVKTLDLLLKAIDAYDELFDDKASLVKRYLVDLEMEYENR